MLVVESNVAGSDVVCSGVSHQNARKVGFNLYLKSEIVCQIFNHFLISCIRLISFPIYSFSVFFNFTSVDLPVMTSAIHSSIHTFLRNLNLTVDYLLVSKKKSGTINIIPVH